MPLMGVQRHSLTFSKTSPSRRHLTSNTYTIKQYERSPLYEARERRKAIVQRCADTVNLSILFVIIVVVGIFSVISNASGEIEKREWQPNPFEKTL